jgi:hypothetical protein
MSRPSSKPKNAPKRNRAGGASPSSAEAPAVEFLPPPRPRRGLFAALMGAMVLWVVFLLVLYFTTVYPQRAKERWQKAHPADGQSTVPRALPS